MILVYEYISDDAHFYRRRSERQGLEEVKDSVKIRRSGHTCSSSTKLDIACKKEMAYDYFPDMVFTCVGKTIVFL